MPELMSVTVRNRSERQSPSKSIRLLECGCDNFTLGRVFERQPTVSSFTNIDFVKSVIVRVKGSFVWYATLRVLSFGSE